MQMVQKSFYIDKPTYSELAQIASGQNLTTAFLQKLGKYGLKGPKNLSKNLDKYVWG